MRFSGGVLNEDHLLPSIRDHATNPSRLDSYLSRAVKVCIALAILVPPFLFGGREAIGQAVLALLALAAGGLAIVRLLVCQRRGPDCRRIEAFLPAAVLVLYVLTWVRLSPGVVQALSPGVGRLLPSWNAGMVGASNHQGWSTFSVAPGLSRDATFLLLLPVMLFWVTLATVRTPEAVGRLLKVIFLCGVGVAVVGFLHYLFWNGKFYGLWQLWWVPPDRQVRAPFTNRNHFAGFLALTLGPGVTYLSWLLRHRFAVSDLGKPQGSAFNQQDCLPNPRTRELSVVLTAVGLILILACIFLSQSRGGAVAALAGLAVSLLGTLADRASRLRNLVVCLCIGLAALAIVFAFGGEHPFSRVAGMLGQDQSLEKLSTHRLTLWKADLHAVADFPFLGSGPGTHAYVYPLYLEEQLPVTFTHAENGYLQVLVECGLAGVLLLGLAIFSVGWWSLRNLAWTRRASGDQAAAYSIGIGASLVAALIQGFVDFVWYVPAYAATVAVLAALACRLYHLRTLVGTPAHLPQSGGSVERMAGRWFWRYSLAGTWVLSAVLISIHFVNRVRIESAWNAYYRLLPPGNGSASSSPQPERLEEQAHWLATACSLGSADPDHHYRLGLVEQERFLNQANRKRSPLTLVELELELKQQTVATASEAAAWISQHYGCDCSLLEQSRNHFRDSLRCCPLLGPAYLRLAEQSFLDNPIRPDRDPYCRQAILVRPNDPLVWFQVGTQRCAVGDIKSAGEYWRKACELQPAYEWKLLPVLGPVLRAEDLVALIPLDFDGLQWLARQPFYRDRMAEKQYLARQAEKLIEADSLSSKHPEAWVALHRFFIEVQLFKEAEACLRKTVRLAPDQPTYRIGLVRWLLEQGERRAALEELQILRERFPGQPEALSLETTLLSSRR